MRPTTADNNSSSNHLKLAVENGRVNWSEEPKVIKSHITTFTLWERPLQPATESKSYRGYLDDSFLPFNAFGFQLHRCATCTNYGYVFARLDSPGPLI